MTSHFITNKIHKSLVVITDLCAPLFKRKRKLTRVALWDVEFKTLRSKSNYNVDRALIITNTE